MPLRSEPATRNWQEAAQHWLRRLEAEEDGVGGTLLIVVAHPDDEVIGIGGQLARVRKVRLLEVTDGAPRNLLDARRTAA